MMQTLAESDVPFERCRFIGYIDSDDVALYDTVKRLALAIPFAEVSLQFTAWPTPKEHDWRRDRHSAMRTASAGLIPKGVKQVLLIEDDTTVPHDTWKRLTDVLAQGYDMATGFEVGRWSSRCAGVWEIADGTCRTKVPKVGIEQVDGCGLYLALCSAEMYLSRHWDKWDDSYGHDTSITHAMTLDGYKIAVDWDLRAIHMTQKGDLDTSKCEVYSRKVKPIRLRLQRLDYTPLTDWLGRPARMHSQKSVPRARRHRLGVTVEHNGRRYVKGSVIDHETAVAMSKAGVLKAEIR
jgi:hypothetical protein